MKLRRTLALVTLLVISSILSGCISIETEIFLNDDGSGELLIHAAFPDLPEEFASQGGGKKPEQNLDDMKASLLKEMPPTMKLKEMKQVKQNGVQGLYAIVEFKSVEDVEKLLAGFGKENLKDSQITGQSQWTVNLSRDKDRRVFTQKFFMDIDDKSAAKAEQPGAAAVAEPAKPAPKAAPKARPRSKGAARSAPAKAEPAAAAKPAEDPFKDLGEQLAPLILSMLKFRFVLHTPAPIVESNADVVLRQRTAVWDTSLAAFSKNKNPIVMRVTY